VVGGRLADLFGRKRVFTLDLLLFLAGAALVVAADGPSALLLGVSPPSSLCPRVAGSVLIHLPRLIPALRNGGRPLE